MSKLRRNVSSHGTQNKQQTLIEPYKFVEKYKILKTIDDDISTKLKEVYENNRWNLKNLFEVKLPEFLSDICNNGGIAWNNGIQFLDYEGEHKAINEISLKKLKEGEYKTLYKDNNRINKDSTERSYALRVEFWAKTFTDFKEYEKRDDLQWIIDNNRLLLYNILNYHNLQENVISTVNSDLKAYTRIIKLLLGEEDELRYKFSTLQVAFTDLENLLDDTNQIASEREVRTFIPYENLLTMCDELEEKYFQMVNVFRHQSKLNTYTDVNQMYKLNEEDGKNHDPKLFHTHQVYLAFALNIWNYPSRTENFTMYFIDDLKDIKDGDTNNYVHLENDKCLVIYNDNVKRHKPVRYYLNSGALIGLNTRLCKLLHFSKKTYPRSPLFIGKTAWKNDGSEIKSVNSGTVSKWMIHLVPNKNIGVNTFRSSFVSYYFPKWNNRQRNVLAIRMRTSIEQIMRAYLKYYTNPDDLVQVKLEPCEELVQRCKTGNSKNDAVVVPAIAHIAPVVQAPVVQAPVVQAPVVQAPMYIDQNDTRLQEMHEKRKASFNKWYHSNNENKEKHKNRTKNAYGERYVRELNNGKIDFTKMNKETVEKYKIKLNNDGKYYIE